MAARKLVKAAANAHYLPQSRIRKCGCCQKASFVVSFSDGEETKFCMRCRANLRYEMLAEAIRSQFPNLAELTVLELDPCSPLRSLLRGAKEYTQCYFSTSDRLGTNRADGARCEDITRLTFPDSSIDLIVSSEVLEHVPDIRMAFRETSRVLRRGGAHLFTAPPRPKTRPRAAIVGGAITYLFEPEYHSDPLSPDGILTFWDIGPDAGAIFSKDDLTISACNGPRGKDKRIVWRASKVR